MRSYACTFVLALVVAVALTPLVRWFAIRVGAVSMPRARDIHQRAVPRLGGVAIAIAFFAPIFALSFIDSSVAETLRATPRLSFGLLAGGAILGGLGVADDTIGVRAQNKLAVQFLVAIFAYAMGFRIDAIAVPLFGVWEMGIFALPVTALWIVGIVNAVNLIDGLDGLAAGVIFFAALTNFIIAVIGGGEVFVAVVMASIMGAMVGFLFYNFNPARIFMGDSGSYFLGFLLATTSLTGAMQKTSTAVSLLVPMVALGVPIFDTLFSMLRRTLERRSLFSADRGHVHHRLIDMGITHRRAVMLLYGVSILLMVSAIAISLGRSWESGVALLAASVILTGLIRFVGYFEYVRLRRDALTRNYDEQTRALRRLVPALTAELTAVSTTEHLWSRLVAFAADAGLGVVELSGVEGAGRRWPANTDGQGRQDLTLARFPLAMGQGYLEFGWRSEKEDVSAQCDVLLHLVADGVEAALERLGTREPPVASAVVGLTQLGPTAQPSVARRWASR